MAQRAQNTFGINSVDPKYTVMKYDLQAIGEGHKYVILKSFLFETNFQSWIQSSAEYATNGKIKLEQYN